MCITDGHMSNASDNNRAGGAGRPGPFGSVDVPRSVGHPPASGSMASSVPGGTGSFGTSSRSLRPTRASAARNADSRKNDPGPKISRKVRNATPVGAIRIGRSYHGATPVVVIAIQHACQGVPTNLHPLTTKDPACSQSISDWFLLMMES